MAESSPHRRRPHSSSTKQDWFPTVFGLVPEAEVRRVPATAGARCSGPHGASSLDCAATIKVVIEGESAETPPSTRSLSVDDERFPTVVVCDAEDG